MDWQYPKEKRKEFATLDLANKSLFGELLISDFPNLSRLDCRYNQLTKLAIANCPQLKFLNTGNNCVTNLVIDYPKQLTSLGIHNNNFPSQDLSFFQHFTNLEDVWLGNNPFYGSLEPLKELKRLKNLDISHTNIDRGLEYLSERSEQIELQKNTDSPEEVIQELQPYSLSGRGALNYSLQQ